MKILALGLVAAALVFWFWPRGHQRAVSIHSPAGTTVAQSGAITSTGTVSATNGVVAADKGRIGTNTTDRLKYRLSNTPYTLKQMMGNRHALLLENALIDTGSKTALKIPAHLKAQGEPGAYMVQARGVVNGAFRSAIGGAGGTIVTYVPNNAYLVQISSAGAGVLAGNPLVQAVLPYEPYYKIQAPLLGAAVAQTPLKANQYLTLGLYQQGADNTMNQIGAIATILSVDPKGPFGPVIRVAPTTADWTSLAALQGVGWVEPAHLRAVANDQDRVAVGVATDTVTLTNYLNLTGTNILVELNDTGIDPTHPDFGMTTNPSLSRVIGWFDPGSTNDTKGHGTHVAGILAGNGAMSGTINTVTNLPSGSVTNANFRGKAPAALLYSFGFLSTNDAGAFITDSDLQEVPARTNALISNNSWANTGDYEYDLSAASYDAAVRDALPRQTGPQPMIFVFAAGNDGGGDDDGQGGTADTINSPGSAKDVVTVGALEQLRNITNIVTALDGTSNAIWAAETQSGTLVAAYSARGNVGLQTEGPYGRFKPDVVAPGTFTVSTRASMWDMMAYFNPTNFHTSFFSDQEVTTDSIVVTQIPVPQNAVGVQVEVLDDLFLSPNPFPTNFPIFVSSSGFPDPTDPNTYDFVTTNNAVNIPPDGGVGYLQGILNGGVTIAIADPTNLPVFFDLFIDVITTNDNGNELTILSNLDNTLTPWYRYETGTSMATPAVSGVMALMEDFFTNRLQAPPPSPALMKALVINGARLTGGYQLSVTNTPNLEGWGLVNLPNSIPAVLTNSPAALTNSPFYYVDQSPTNLLATGDSITYLISTSNNPATQIQPMRLTLAWTDPPGNPAAAIKLVNQLALVVTNLDDNTVYYANNFTTASSQSTIPSATNDPVQYDAINNVQSIILPPLLGTNYSVTVLGVAVNVNAVTTEETNIVQDFALVVSCGDGSNTNGFTMTASPTGLQSTNSPNVNYLVATNGIYFNQIAGANAPWLSTNDIGIGFGTNFEAGTTNTLYFTNSVYYIGQTNQWHFYVITNTFAITNADFTNAAFITFIPNTQAIPREGVYAGTDANSTTPEAELDLFVATSPDALAASLTDINPEVVSNCLFGLNGDGSAIGRGGTKFVAYNNSQASQVYYVGVRCQDQMAGQYAFLPIFSNLPFSTLDQNGNQQINGVPVPQPIPDGNNRYPGVGYVVGLALYPMEIRRVITTNTYYHQNFGDLVGTLNHSGTSVILNNHDGLGLVQPTRQFVYDDSGQGDLGTTNIGSDGPGSLNNFRGAEAIGPWIFTEVDNSFTETGYVNSVQIRVEPHRDLRHQPFITVEVAPGSWFYDFVDVPVGFTNLLVVATNLAPTVVPPVQLYVQEGSTPTFATTNVAFLTNCISGTYPGGLDPGNQISLGPPLTPDRYFVGLFNPSLQPADVLLGAILTFDQSAINTVDFASTDTPMPLLDDAVNHDNIFVGETRPIQEFKVGLRVDHPRISDLVFTLIDPNGDRFLLMENRGGQSTNGCGLTVIQTNIIPVVASGGSLSATNFIFTGQFSGTFPISYNFFVAPDEMTVYYGTNLDPADLIYDTGFTNGAANITVSFPPPGSTTMSQYLTIVMNQFDSSTNRADAWQYTAGGVFTNYVYLDFTEDTNFTMTPIKLAPTPFVPGIVTNTVITSNMTLLSTFDSVAAADYTVGQTVDGWTVTSNEVSVVNDPSNSLSGNQFLALANGSLSRSISTVPGTTNTLSFAYRGPGIAGWWRGENTFSDTSGNGNNGTLNGSITFTNGEVGNAFQYTFNNYISVPNSTTMDVGAGGGLTMEAWNNPDATVYDLGASFCIMEWDSTNLTGIPAVGVHMFDEGNHTLYGNIRDTLGNDHQIQSPNNAITPGVYQHIAITYNKTTGIANLYVNGVLLTTKNLGVFNPQTTFSYYIGERLATGPGVPGSSYQGLLDEVSVYNRALSGSEIQAIASNGTNGKFDPINPAPSNLSEMLTILNGTTNAVLLGNNTVWQTNSVTFVATGSTTQVTITGLEPGMLLDSFSLATITTNVVSGAANLYYQPEQSLDPLIGMNPFGTWTLEVLDNRAGAYSSNSPPQLVSWQLEMEFANTNIPVSPVTLGSGPSTNVVGPNSIEWYQVNVPTNALASTNTLIFATAPVNFWYSPNTPPTIIRPNDIELAVNTTGPNTFVFSSNTVPVLAPGTTYYLGVQNTNNFAVTNAVSVTFLLGPTPPILPNIPNQVMGLGTTLIVSNMATDTNAGAVLAYTLVSPPPIAVIDPLLGTITIATTTNTPPTNAVITTIVNDTTTGLSATNSFVVVVLPFLIPGQPQTNIISPSAVHLFGNGFGANATPVGPNGIYWYGVSVPTNAVAATNSLLSATGPVNLCYSTNIPPTLGGKGDATLLTGQISGSAVLTLTTIPPLVVNSFSNTLYFLGVQNPSSTVTVTDVVEVTFRTGPPGPSLPFIPTQYIDGGDTLVVTNTATNPNTNDLLVYQLVSPPVNAVIDTNGIITWPTTTNQAPATVTILTIATDTTTGQSATNSFQVVLELPLGNGLPQTNTVPANSIDWLVVHVPLNALQATNALLSATLPLNLRYSVNVPQTITNANDYELLTNLTSGTNVINPGTVPALVPGSTYYLGLQNTNGVAVTAVVQVTFQFGPPILPSIPFQVIVGGNTLVVTNTAIDGLPGATLAYSLAGPPTGAMIDSNGIVTWPTPVVSAPTDYVITTIVTNNLDGLSATNSFNVLVLPILNPSGPTTNVVAPGGIQWFQVNVPTNALAATNTLLFATLPVNLLFSTNAPPTTTNSYDFELLTNATSGISVITPTTIPVLRDGSIYFLGVQNTNAIPVTNAIDVTFELPQPPVFRLSITATNIGGTNGYLLSWPGGTTNQFHLQWTPSLLPLNWKNFKGVISYMTFVTPTNSLFAYFDGGSQTAGFGADRFYRLQLLNSPTNTAPFFLGTPPDVNLNVGDTLTVTNPGADFDSPAQILTYQLLTPVTGTNPPAINGTNAVITWTPDMFQTNSTNVFTTIVTDNGVPPKSATNTFLVLVNPLPGNSLPVLGGAIQVTNGIQIYWTGPTNDQFNVRWATNLMPPIIWSNFPPIITSSNGLFIFVDTNKSGAMKFYQLILLP